ncbi:phage major tail tube protein [Methylosinus sp. PW1]|uniref:phage major tail tube protein n=1 Tax=Methylosinus sp. PW1 TaxID=107636 RepID=UPI0005665334|nr:phage major tail tube protein [Methylosinus sp. PW1]
MAASVIIWEAANLFAGDDGPNNSKHLTLQAIMLPQLKEKSAEHHAGGSIGALTIGGLGLEAFELSFKLIGADAQTKAMFGLGTQAVKPYTVYGVLRDKNGGRAIERKVVVFGRLLELNEQEHERGKLGEQDHKVGEITHYELYEDKQEIYYYDFFNSTWRVNGVDRNADMNAILRIS